MLSGRGGLTIPVEIRRALAIEDGGELVVEATPLGLLLRPVCAFDAEPLDADDEARDAVTSLARRKARRKVH